VYNLNYASTPLGVQSLRENIPGVHKRKRLSIAILECLSGIGNMSQGILLLLIILKNCMALHLLHLYVDADDGGLNI
jgi:hypothetical protein